jgi:PadR family transcriptional regulator AphA
MPRSLSLSKKGREHLAAWLAVEPQPEIPRNELLLKLFFGAQVPTEILIGYVERMVEVERALVLKFTRAGDEAVAGDQQYPDAPYWRMAARFGQLELEAHLRWAEETLAELNEIAGKQRSHSES